MELLVITPEKILENETEAINLLFAKGLEVLHLRKPEATAHDIRLMLERINTGYHNRIVLHDHFALTGLYNLKGVHLNRRNPEHPADRNLMVSKSCHSLYELTDLKAYNYVFLSPIFDSISKDGYHKAFTEEELITARNEGLICPKVYALGGISAQQIPLAARFGFGGVAVLGALWAGFGENGNMGDLLNRFGELNAAVQKIKTELL